MSDVKAFRWLLIGFATLFLGPQISFAEAFTIQHYDVKIHLNSDGSFDVVETIDLYFHEARRGILRPIPVNYRQDQATGEPRALRPIGPELYSIIIEDVGVKDHNFTHYHEGDHLVIRIGDANKTLSGSQRYVISYTVWGALNEFEDRVEFTWNVIGMDWNTTIDKATFRISADAPLNFSSENTIYHTGRMGSRAQDAQVDFDNRSISGQSTRGLRPREGISLATRHPRGHFSNVQIPIEKLADRFFVKNQRYDFQLTAPGKVEIQENFKLQFKRESQVFRRTIGTALQLADNGSQSFPYPLDIQVHSGEEKIDYRIERNGNYTDVVFHKSDGSPFTGAYEVELNYLLWGAVVNHRGNPEYLLMPSSFTSSEPVEDLVITGTGDALSGAPVFFAGNNDFSLFWSESGQQWERHLSYPEIRSEYGLLGGRVVSRHFSEEDLPPEVYGNHYLVDGMNLEVRLEYDQTINIASEYRVLHPLSTPYKTYRSVYPWRITKSSDYFDTDFAPSAWNLLDRKVVPVSNYDSEKGTFGSFRSGHVRRGGGSDVVGSSSWENRETISYKGIYSTSGDDQLATIPLLHKSNEFRRGVELGVSLAEEIDPAFLQVNLRVGTDRSYPLVFEGGSFGLNVSEIDLRPGESAVLVVSGPRGFAGSLSLGNQLYLLIRNNIPLWIILLSLVALYLIWNKIGRNRSEAVVVQYYPPKTITSAEAGLLWDDRLHRKDLISLIYYWAGRGYLEVEEIQTGKKKDYILRKLKDLSKDAKLFEKTFFKGLFIKDEIKISELRSNFASTMRLAHKDLMQYSKTNDFYVPGSRGFGCGMTVFGVLLLLLGVFGIGVAFFTGYWSYAVAPLTIGMAMLFFGRIMPKKGPFGFKKHQKLKGFQEFVRSAEIDRIKVLYKENPGYFDATIAYAIVFGLGKKWAEKFDGFMTEPPSWYKGYNRSRPFTTVYFTESLIHSMHRMNYDLSLPSSSTGGSGASSWGGSGGGSFGGGFSSGGGFGGGGGSSW